MKMFRQTLALMILMGMAVTAHAAVFTVTGPTEPLPHVCPGDSPTFSLTISATGMSNVAAFELHVAIEDESGMDASSLFTLAPPPFRPMPGQLLRAGRPPSTSSSKTASAAFFPPGPGPAALPTLCASPLHTDTKYTAHTHSASLTPPHFSTPTSATRLLRSFLIRSWS